VDAIESKLGSDILLLDISDITLIADYFVIATGESDRQLSALVDAVGEKTRTEYNLKPLHTEGVGTSGWVLLDYGAIVVHLFTPSQREFYALEELWQEGRTVLRMA